MPKNKAKKEFPVQKCPQCGAQMFGVRGATQAACPNCGYKETCCY